MGSLLVRKPCLNEPGSEPAEDAVTGSHVPLAVRQQHDLAEHSAFAQHFVRAARLFERQPLRDQGLGLAFFEQVQQRAELSPSSRTNVERRLVTADTLELISRPRTDRYLRGL